MATANSGMENKGTGFNTFAVVAGVLAVLIFVYALSLFLQGGFLTTRNLEKEVKVMTPEDTVVQDALAQQNALLHEGIRWIDQEKGVVGMPIDDAKALLVRLEARKDLEN